MLRGFRWQFAALLLSIFVFGLSLTFRLTNTPQPPPTETPAPTQVTQASATPTETATPSATPQTVSLEPTAIPDTVSTFREALIGPITRLNPLLVSNQAEADVTALIYEGLTRINTFGEPVGALAMRWVLSRDGLEYVFELRRDVLWQDGTPFTADDVLYSFSLLSDAAYPSAEQVAFWQTVEVQKLDDHLVRFRLAQPLSSFPTRLTIGLLPEHALRGTTAADLATHPINLQPIGTGPYQLEALRSTDAQGISIVDLRHAPTYQQREDSGAPFPIERVRFQLYPTFEAALTALNNATVDGLATQTMAQRLSLMQSQNTQLYTELFPAIGMLVYNWGDAEDPSIFADQRVRRGLQLALSRNGSVERALTAQALLSNSPILASSWAYDPTLTWPQTDSTAATELLQRLDRLTQTSSEESEATENSAEPIEFSILVPEVAALTSIAQEFAAQWSGFDLNVSVETVALDVHQARIEASEFDVALVELPLNADPDIYAYWHVSQYPDGRNYGGMADDRISELLGRARRESNGLNRVVLYRDVQQAFIERAVAIPLYYPLFTYAVSEQVSGLQMGFINTPSDRFRSLSNWSFES